MSDMRTVQRQVLPVLDHVVLNVMGQLDEAAAQYVRLGFQLTERGHHTLGSSNNLAIFGTNYLELLGYLPGRETMRADLWAHPPGLSGLVFKSVDADLVYATLKDNAVPVMEPMSFARPVELPDGAQDARFKVIRVAGDEVQNGRTNWCGAPNGRRMPMVPLKSSNLSSPRSSRHAPRRSMSACSVRRC
jgi:hypothetical protein